MSCPLSEIDYNLNVYSKVIPVIFTGYIDVELAINGPSYNLVIFDFVSDPVAYRTLDSWSTTLKNIDQDDYELRSLCATGNIYDANGLNPYKILIKKQNESTVWKYEHFPLIWSVINNDNTKISENDRTFILNLINEAPSCGANKYKDGNIVKYRNFNWSSPSRLIWPERLGEDLFLGEYNGLDYMLLHNLFWLANMIKYPSNIDYDPNQTTDHNIIATNQISCSKEIQGNKTLNFIAGNNIKRLPGFLFNSNDGGNLNISTYESGSSAPFFFKEISVSDYPLCNSELKQPASQPKNLMNTHSSKNDNKSESDIKIFPNPCKDFIEITVHNEPIVRIEIFNSSNLVIKQIKRVFATNLDVDISDLPSGIYFVRIETDNGTIQTKKIIKL